jgi:hypothetical protein
MTRRLTLCLGLVMAISLIAVPAVAAKGAAHHAKPLPSRIALPDGFQPEGLTSGWGNRLYVGSLVDGAIWRGNVKTGTGSIFIAGIPGQSAAGIHFDVRGRLWVAGASDKTVRVYSRAGVLLQTYSFPTAGFINDLVITRKGVYATDSTNAQLLVIPARTFGPLPTPDKATTLAITGDMTNDPSAFNMNGIVESHGWLVVVNTNLANLFRINPKTGVSKIIELHGYSPAFGDGLILRGRFLYVIQNQENKVAVIKLSANLRSGKYIGKITSSSLDVPTTGAFAAGKLYVVNARFNVADPTTAKYWISRLRVSPKR